ncbi:molybdate ABC transporter substrate-binding protein [Rhodococcoides corynebacterioides]|uniref:Molybdate ABC transporter substrate-binding protein n=1 Tax=Rhodococcoides corynebacterioides TaxID=53972 RepID=A0ABS7P832_9NOCA|nr:molybdate ABC transporter substrate-binding protein [Rhodococcus corynebacterioides]MBY6368593.1 molybdate ABC transporter substrate-binding protein [Rhodococcus corynebacterioides]MBY6409893.1 molybdate ABC transporter substrate-binding protein [Rhodococcus corynebacterioides]
MTRFRLVLAAAALLLAGCSTSETPAPAADGAVGGEITVFAAASLKATFTELGERFEAAYPGTTVALTFAGSSDLLTQLSQGAPGDVFASADTATMTRAVDAGLVSGEPTPFATNTLTIVTPPDNPRGIASFADLADPGAKVVVCAPQVPCGAATAAIEAATGVDLTPVSEESAVTDVLGKVTAGEADAGLVYVTDAAGAGERVATVPFAESGEAVNTYPVAVLSESRNATAAQAFEEFVLGPEGREVLDAAGFAAP